MRRSILAWSLLVALLLSMPAWGKIRRTPVYIFGASASFNDSVVYFTDIQVLDSAWIDEKTDFLVNRQEYSNQLRDHFNATGHPSRTCLVAFSTKEKDITKKYAKMRKKFRGTSKKPKNFDIRELDEDEFKFRTIVPSTIDEEDQVEKVSKKAVKRAAKAKKKGVGKKPGKADNEAAMPPSMPPRH